jgi:hypothetical protein
VEDLALVDERLERGCGLGERHLPEGGYLRTQLNWG